MKSKSVVLYAEDEEDDVFFLEHAFQTCGSLHKLSSVPDGEQAIQYLAGEGPFADRGQHPLPCLVLLDINMPKKSGLDVLEWMRSQPHLQSLPVVILTSSSRPEDMKEARRLRADDYLLKPASPPELVDLVKSLHVRWLQQAVAESLHR